MFGCKGKELERIRSRVGCLIEGTGAVWQHECIYKPENKCELFVFGKRDTSKIILETVGLEGVRKKKNETFFPWNEAASRNRAGTGRGAGSPGP